VENRAYKLPENTIINSRRRTYLRLTKALFKKIRQRKYREIADKLLHVAIARVPRPLRTMELSRKLAPTEHVLKSLGSALGANPFNPERHDDFADALCEIGAFGAARMHYQQALVLRPDDERAAAGIAFIDSPRVSEQQRAAYFISWSDEPPPLRHIPAEISQAETKIDIHVSPVTMHQGGTSSVFKKVTQWVRPE
jgi:hypothetical protein